MVLCRSFAVAFACLTALAHGQREPAAVPPHVEQFVQAHCLDCHGGDAVKGKLDLTRQPEDAVDRLSRWARMRERVLAGEMPPPDPDSDPELQADGPGSAQRDRFGDWIESMLATEVPQLAVDPGRVTVRRLSRTHWQNVVRDLFGVEVSTEGFPADDLGYGFDSIGDALSFSTLHLEQYLAAAREVAAVVFHGEDPNNPERRHFEAEAMYLVDDRGALMNGDVAHMYTNSTIEQPVRLPRDGVYRLRVDAGAQQAGDEAARMLLQADGRQLGTFEVARVEPRSFTLTAKLTGGPHRFALSFVNDYYEPEHPDPERRDRNLRIDAFDIVGPTDVRPVPEQQHWLHAAAEGRTDIARLRSQIAMLLPTLWRRPVTAIELQRLERAGVDRLRAGESLVAAQRFVVTAALTSPHFLFRIERDARGDQGGCIGGDELAVRLSFFLWGSTPDGELAELGRRGRLLDEQVLLAQVDRLLRDERAENLATDFAAQWLELRLLADRTPDPARFPGFNAALRRSMRRESELLFLTVLREGRDVRDLLDCEFTYVDRALADFYGLAAAQADGSRRFDGFWRVDLAGSARLRGGLLGHASVLAVTSNPTRTSPVKRGKWLLENLLGQAPPPPPPGNDSFTDEAAIDSAATLRMQMAQHRARPECAVCHLRMDALGLALERFDVIGRYRDRDAGGDIDATGLLPDGRRLDGLADLKRVLVADPAFVQTLAHKLFIHGVGRDLRPVDRLRIDLAVASLLSRGTVTIRDLLVLVVLDQAFGQRA